MSEPAPERGLLSLNLGSGSNPIEGFVNVDRYGDPDLRLDLEHFPWPWADNSVGTVLLSHVLEHLCPMVDDYRRLWQEIYRVCAPGATVIIRCPHPASDNFRDDPTHVRMVTPRQFTLFDREFNRECAKNRWANSPLGEHWGIDFQIEKVEHAPSELWRRNRPHGTPEVLAADAATKLNQIDEFTVVLRARKPHA